MKGKKHKGQKLASGEGAKEDVKRFEYFKVGQEQETL